MENDKSEYMTRGTESTSGIHRHERRSLTAAGDPTVMVGCEAITIRSLYRNTSINDHFATQILACVAQIFLQVRHLPGGLNWTPAIQSLPLTIANEGHLTSSQQLIHLIEVKVSLETLSLSAWWLHSLARLVV